MVKFAHGYFNESYFEHACSIVPEKDVIDTDIPGSSRATRLRRWWFDLFLLSYTDRRAKIYYTSSHAIKKDRMQHFRYHRSRIHPLSKFRHFWDVTIFIAMVVTTVLNYHATSILYGQAPWWIYAFGVVLEFVVIFDIYVNTRCGYIDHVTKTIILDTRKSFIKYCSSKIFFHFTSIVPILSLLFLRYGFNITCAKCKVNCFVCTLVVMNVFKVLRVYEVSSYLSREKNTFTSTSICRLIRLCLLAVLSVLQFLCMYNAIYLLLIIKTGKIKEDSLQHIMLYAIFVSDEPLQDEFLFAYTYLRVLALLVHHNSFHSSAILSLDKISPIFVYCTASIFHVLAILEVIAVFNRKYFPEDQIIFTKCAAKNMAACRQLPDKLGRKISLYYDFNMTKQMVVEKQNGLFKSLPVIIKRDVVISSYIRKTMRIPYFSDWPMEIIEKLVVLMKEDIYLKDDLVTEVGEQGAELVIIDAGVMVIYTSEHVEKGRLIDGEYFGELSLVTDKEHVIAYVVAETNCKVITLEKSAFRMFMRNLPKLFFEMKQSIINKFRSGEGHLSIQELRP